MEKEYLWLDPRGLVRAPEHEGTLDFNESEDYSVFDSYEHHGRIDVVLAAKRVINNESKNAVYNGWKYVHYAVKNKIDKVLVCLVQPKSDDDLVSLMVQLQRSHHNSLEAIYKMIEALWPKYYKGQGYRSDLNEDQAQDELTDEKGKPLSIYGKIGRELLLSANTVKHIRVVGKYMPQQFERIKETRLSLYAAYLAAKKYQNEELQEVKDDSEEIEYSVPVCSDDYEDVDSSDGYIAPSYSDDDKIIDDYDHFIISAICTSCNSEVKIKIKKEDLL